MNLGKMLEESCRQYGENVAIIHDDISLTYNELNRAANAIGNRLRSSGLKKGDKVALLLSNCLNIDSVDRLFLPKSFASASLQ